MKSRFLPLCLAAFLSGAGGLAVSDDSLLTNKSMSNTIQLPIFEQEAVNALIPEAEHAFTDMLLFYVPAQAASGESVDPLEYVAVDGELVQDLAVAKPLVNTFIYGPLLEPEDTAFFHSWMDTYAAVSLDDGLTWKQTNLSESATLSSFNLEDDHIASDDLIPDDHSVLLKGVYHKPGYDYPYSNGCAHCHGVTLEGGKGESCYSCHGSIWEEAKPDGIGPTVFKAEWKKGDGGALKAVGKDAPAGALVTVINAGTKETLASKWASGDGDWEIEAKRLISSGLIEKAPCTIAAVANGVEGPAMVPKGTPEDCEGAPEPEIDLTNYPGGTYNVFQASSGNKILVAWPSRFCEQGQAGYSIAYDGDDTDLSTDQLAKRNAVATLLGVDVTRDLYLTDLFGVAGAQGSIDFAEEGYPQAGVVPFGCVWTARGLVLPGDDPRTTDTTESSHVVWTKAERLTSGRRDPNRIEVHGLQGAGFVITWQEDPDGLRPGQGEGPGEGWSGAVAHDKTDVWYSFIPWEYFDLVENPDAPAGEPVNIVDHDLTLSGRPQVYVPMAVPMRLTNNDKCDPDYKLDPSQIDPARVFSYCNHGVAAAYGLKDHCADTVDIPLGPQGTLQPICVNEDGLPNLANTASTRPRTALQGYDSDGDGAIDSGWVIVAAEESKGLGRYLFLPDGTACTDETNPDCQSDIGKNIWYFSFDMGDPATSAGSDDRDGLVANLVNQGNLLNQPEVDWRTGELYPVINTAQMWDFGDYNFDLYNTEIARRSSMLSQGMAKAMASESGLMALPSWKQGAMQQGGPADTMFRRIRFDFGDGAQVCPLEADVDAGKPMVTAATYVPATAKRGALLRVTITDYDGLSTTGIQLRNVVTGDAYGNNRFVDEGGESVSYNIDAGKWPVVPCAVQAADRPRKATLDSLSWGPWIAVSNPEDIPGGCVGEIPAECVGGNRASTNLASWSPEDGNPYAFRHMECVHVDGSDGWILTDGSNPYYPDGICLAPATNLSSVVPDTCKDDDTDVNVPCPMVDFSSGTTFGIGDTNPILQGYTQGEGDTTRVLAWHQCPSDGVVQDISELEGTYEDCATDYRTDDFVNLKDQSWYNPLDVSKGHRGFIDGDFVMFLYAWSPNWRLNAKGSDRYDLYVRRSFDGGETWQTTPTSFKASNGQTYSGDGTVTCETYRSGDSQVPGALEPHLCYAYPAGGNEQARNVTQHKRMRITTLDPRFAPSGGPRGQGIAEGCVDVRDPTVDSAIMTCDDLSTDHDTDRRNPSRFGIVFETGDNNTVTVGEAEPLDLFYSRAESFGDDYVVWAETDSATADPSLCYPSNAHEDADILGTVIEASGFCNEFDRMNTRGDTHSSEADLELNPAGTMLYGVWTQWVFENDDYDLPIVESDAMARRMWWIDDYISDTESWTLPGTAD